VVCAGALAAVEVFVDSTSLEKYLVIAERFILNPLHAAAASNALGLAGHIPCEFPGGRVASCRFPSRLGYSSTPFLFAATASRIYFGNLRAKQECLR